MATTWAVIGVVSPNEHTAPRWMFKPRRLRLSGPSDRVRTWTGAAVSGVAAAGVADEDGVRGVRSTRGRPKACFLRVPVSVALAINFSLLSATSLMTRLVTVARFELFLGVLAASTIAACPT